MPSLRREGLGYEGKRMRTPVVRGVSYMPVTMAIIAAAGDQSTQTTRNLQCQNSRGDTAEVVEVRDGKFAHFTWDRAGGLLPSRRFYPRSQAHIG